MKNVVSAILFSSITLLSGCATLFDDTSDNVKLVTTDDNTPRETRCDLENEEGQWSGFANTGIQVHKDGNPMKVKCENDAQIGEATVSPDFQEGYIFLNVIFDLCIISCPVDGINNAFYDYPDQVTVPMQAKAK